MDQDAVRVYVALDDPEIPAGEIVWAVPVGDDRYRIVSIPFFVKEFGLGDVAKVVDGRFMEVVERAGSRTADIFFGDVTPEARSRVLAELRAAGARVERAWGPIYAADVPAGGAAVMALLDEEQASGALGWEWRVPTGPPSTVPSALQAANDGAEPAHSGAPEKVQLLYRVPVTVAVDMQHRRVDRVRVLAEDVVLDADADAWDQATGRPVGSQADPTTDVVKRAVAIAEGGEWPAWEL